VTVIGAVPVFVKTTDFDTVEPAGTLPKSRDATVERTPAGGADEDPTPEYACDNVLLPEPELLEMTIDPEYVTAATGLKVNVSVEVKTLPFDGGGTVPLFDSALSTFAALPNDTICHVRGDPPVLLIVSVRNAALPT
jgi:hypothetical protein